MFKKLSKNHEKLRLEAVMLLPNSISNLDKTLAKAESCAYFWAPLFFWNYLCTVVRKQWPNKYGPNSS